MKQNKKMVTSLFTVQISETTSENISPFMSVISSIPIWVKSWKKNKTQLSLLVFGMLLFCFKGSRTWADTRPVEDFMSYEGHPVPKATLTLSSSKRKKGMWLDWFPMTLYSEHYSI